MSVIAIKIIFLKTRFSKTFLPFKIDHLLPIVSVTLTMIHRRNLLVFDPCADFFFFLEIHQRGTEALESERNLLVTSIEVNWLLSLECRENNQKKTEKTPFTPLSRK